MKKLRLLLVAVLAFTMLAGTVAQAEDAEPITITFLHCWNGGGANFPSDQVNNLVAQKLLEETGVIMQMESLVTSELERLNTMFASGVLPDLVNAPYWSTTSGEGEVIKDAASQGLLYDIKDLLPDYPNVQKLYEVGVALDYWWMKAEILWMAIRLWPSAQGICAGKTASRAMALWRR